MTPQFASLYTVKYVAALVIISIFTPQSCVKSEPSTLETVTSVLCDKPLVLLGEGGQHGEGTTTAFKGALIENLIASCGFNAVIFESSTYEFADIRTRVKAGDIISEERLAQAIGGLWAYDRDFQPLLETLTRELNSGQITMAGLDDQLSGRGQIYANDDMMAELTEYLPPPRRDYCREKFRQKIYLDFPVDEPYSKAVRADLMSCLLAIDDAPQRRADLPAGDMTKSIGRWLSGDFLSFRTAYQIRDRSMYENYLAIQNSGEAGQKAIIWGATIHLSKSARTIPAFSDGPNFGELLVQGSKEKPYVLGFSSGSGRIRLPGGAQKTLTPVTYDSLEGTVLRQSNRNSIFVDKAKLERFGAIKASALNNNADVKNWDDVLDGIVVFREQQPSIGKNR